MATSSKMFKFEHVTVQNSIKYQTNALCYKTKFLQLKPAGAWG
jgi:hypothetical protein